MATVDAVRELSDLLTALGATPRLLRDRVAPSTLYDSEYHFAMVACAFKIHAERDSTGRRHILAAWLKLLQFVAARPQLAPDLRTWADSRRSHDLDSWRKMPRGYVGDRTHDSVVDLLVAVGIFERQKDYLLEGPQGSHLDRIAETVATKSLFVSERQALESIVGITVSKTMLGGG